MYQGNLVRVTDPAGKWKEFISDAMGNLVKVTEPNPAGGTADTLYTYSALDKLIQVDMTREGVLQQRKFIYDAATQRLSRTENPETGAVNYYYRTDGLLDTRSTKRTRRSRTSMTTTGALLKSTAIR